MTTTNELLKLIQKCTDLGHTMSYCIDETQKKKTGRIHFISITINDTTFTGIIAAAECMREMVSTKEVYTI